MNNGAFRKISHQEWQRLGGDGNPLCDWYEGAGYVIHDQQAQKELEEALARRRVQDDEAQDVPEIVENRKWRPMAEAPKDGKHCILAMKRGPFVYAIQGAFMNGKWMNAADIDGEPLCWMPNAPIPDEFLPWTDEYLATQESR